MAEHYHAVAWIDHHEARIIHFNRDVADDILVRPAHPPRHLHGKAGSAAGTHVTDEPQFYADVAAALGNAQAILVAGPSSAKTEFIKYLHRHNPQMLDRVWGIETLAQVTDHQLAAEARRYFAKADRMHPQLG